jgi:pimeloyl-ACP methyl ester carboxylesterase
MAGRPTAAGRAVSAALRAAGARPGDPVLLAGHSEGGLVAAAVAADPLAGAEFRITHVVMFGSPASGVRPTRDVQVLAIEHTDDVVPRLDGAPDPESRRWITVTRSAAGDPPAPGAVAGDPLVAAHGMLAYRRTAAAVDASTAPSITAWRAGAADFFARPGARGATAEFLASRSAT